MFRKSIEIICNGCGISSGRFDGKIYDARQARVTLTYGGWTHRGAEDYYPKCSDKLHPPKGGRK